MTQPTFIFTKSSSILPSSQCTWKAPSNIALVKYWGKHGRQLPQNPSLSFTLSNCFTQTTLRYTPKTQPTEEIAFKVFFEEKETPAFRPKIEQFFNHIKTYVPFVNDYEFEIHTQNSFPHSSGIASSASGMAALAACIMDMEQQLNPEITKSYFNQKASFLARLGSGSAARSIEGPITIWGQHPALKDSSDLYATRNQFPIHNAFKNYQDTILLVDKGEKTVSSSVGHNLMIGHPFASSRFDQAFVNLELLKNILQKGDLDEFIKITESEALSLHAVMMTSSPYYLLMKPNTIQIIQAIWKYRQDTKAHLSFTLDAGANVHLLYPETEKASTQEFIDSTLKQWCQNGAYISDHTGKGISKIA